MKPQPEPTYRVAWRHRLFRWLFRPIFRFLFHLLSDVNIYGIENIPADQPYLVAINHVSLYEPPFVLAFWPRPLEAVGAVEIWQRRGQATLAHLYGGIQVHRGQFDRQLIDNMLSAVRSGYPLLIAPEGGRTHTLAMRRALPGAAYIIHKANLPVIPVGIVGTTDDFFTRAWQGFWRRGPRARLEMHIGKPVILPEVSGRGENRRQALQANADLIMAHIGRMLPEAYYGEYADSVRQLTTPKR